MKKSTVVTLVALTALGQVGAAHAQVHVDGYLRSDGTYVSPYERTYPNGTTEDNYSQTGRTDTFGSYSPPQSLYRYPVERERAQDQDRDGISNRYDTDKDNNGINDLYE